LKNVDEISYFKAELLKFQGKIQAILKAATQENKFFSLPLKNRNKDPFHQIKARGKVPYIWLVFAK